MSEWKIYNNGNYRVGIDLASGTKIRETEDDVFISEFPENIDIKITNQCDMGCPMCHENSYPDGKHGNIMKAKFINTLRPYTELAIGGGNALSHPDLIPFLENIKQFDNAVVHVINGVVTYGEMEFLADNGLKVLILGYKDFRRGESYKKLRGGYIECNQINLKGYLKDFIPRFKALSFDNLAIEQLNVKSLMTQEQWDEFYMGDDGQFTMYIDMVTETFAKNSVAALNKRYHLLDNIDDMFAKIKEESV